MQYFVAVTVRKVSAMANPFKKLFKPKEGSPRFRLEMAEKICKHPLKYITKPSDNIEDGDIIIGKGGICYMKNGEFTVTSQEKTLFRTDIEQLEAYELMSLEGAVCKGPDKENNNEYRTVTVFYKYYRK